MKQNNLLVVFALLIVTGALCRIFPLSPFGLYGFAPQLAMAIFGGAVLSDKKWAFAVPLFSMLLSDAIFEALYRAGYTSLAGFYEGQWINYLLIAGITFLGIAMRRINITNIAVSSVAAPVLFFLTSNFATWLGHGGYQRPMTGSGLIQTYIDGVPFFYGSLAATIFYSAALFGIWWIIKNPKSVFPQKAVA